MVAVLIAMIAIGIQKPDMGHVVAVSHDIPLVTAIGPVMNIILAFGTSSSLFSIF
jgi:hypothetical protein